MLYIINNIPYKYKIPLFLLPIKINNTDSHIYFLNFISTGVHIVKSSFYSFNISPKSANNTFTSLSNLDEINLIIKILFYAFII